MTEREWLASNDPATIRSNDPQQRSASNDPPGQVPHVEMRNNWLTPTVLSLAQAVYEERLTDGALAPDLLGILADALEDADCDNEEVLRHLRGQCDFPGCIDGWIVRSDGRPGADRCRRCQDLESRPMSPVHVRGCWAVDLLLGKE